MKILNVLFNKFIYRRMIIKKMNFCGKNFRLGYSSELLNAQYFSIKNDFFTGPYCYFSTNKNNPVQIGNQVMLGPDCKIIGGNHDYTFNKKHMYFNHNIDHMNSSITIEDGAWIGAGSTILSNAHISEGAIVGAMSLVNSFVPPYCIAVGIPAKRFKKRFSKKDDLHSMLVNIESKYTFDEINKIYKRYNLEY